jgi:hypothetical protein
LSESFWKGVENGERGKLTSASQRVAREKGAVEWGDDAVVVAACLALDEDLWAFLVPMDDCFGFGICDWALMPTYRVVNPVSVAATVGVEACVDGWRSLALLDGRARGG